jgi:hypothetical protein
MTPSGSPLSARRTSGDSARFYVGAANYHGGRKNSLHATKIPETGGYSGAEAAGLADAAPAAGGRSKGRRQRGLRLERDALHVVREPNLQEDVMSRRIRSSHKGVRAAVLGASVTGAKVVWGSKPISRRPYGPQLPVRNAG